MREYFADLHIHVGRNEAGKWVKIPTSKNLTVRNILEEASTRKGMDIVGLVDALSPLVLSDLERLIAEGLLTPLGGGGYRYRDLTVLLGAEIETAEAEGGLAHTLIYLPDFAAMKRFSEVMSRYIRNIHISSQNAHMPLARLVEIAASFEAVIIPAHVFTPYKSLYGSCADRLSHLLPERLMAKISAIELGLSADTFMADRIDELAPFTFVTNSDAHSLVKIAREYNVLRLEAPTWQECLLAIARRDGRAVTGNYGLNPLLGKYHRSLCSACGYLDLAGEIPVHGACPHCGSIKIIKGVFDRIEEIAAYPVPQHPVHRPPYHYQIPLEFVPGLGRKLLEKLLDRFGSEMRILHTASLAEIAAVIGEKLAVEIDKARTGQMAIAAGGGGYYGKLVKD
ncbi:conserved hypothetical protein [Thermosinus carboxydivorans Nor1]|uniref:TIGR00375 family protein n=1 Tax=Thermosinus carboxydivorans Nor1 TaxID=401526 RepID=A1HTQ5_9FIRM|nr:endonuclease Q family protein [Thermosinus carboxydivorans]EAX46605.1 conserved hypothetical protein [Thermosinus carboxydivorans Nor1]